MEELHTGPNGSLIYCMEYLLDNIEWLQDDLGDYNDDYLLVDCPGQIELYTHYSIMKKIIDVFVSRGYHVCGLYLLESHFIDEISKYFSGVLSAMSAMIQLEIPHLNVLSKMDLCSKDCEFPDDELSEIYQYLNVDPTLIRGNSRSLVRPRFRQLTEAIVQLIEEYSMVSFIPLNINSEESIDDLLSHIDNAVQYGEDVEPKEPHDEELGYDSNDE